MIIAKTSVLIILILKWIWVMKYFKKVETVHGKNKKHKITFKVD